MSTQPDERDLGEIPGEDVYWRMTRLHGLFGEYLTESRTACDLYGIASELTELWELGLEDPSIAAALMRDATDELLAVREVEELDAYVLRWTDRLASLADRRQLG